MDAGGNAVGVGARQEEDPAMGKNVRFASEGETKSKFDFERLESSLGKITQLLETTATKNAELEATTHYQADTIEKLTSALQQSAEQIKSLGEGQQQLVDACEELRKMAKEREERWEKMSIVGSTTSTGSCGHDVRRPPRKVGRKVIGYVYGEKENGIAESVRE
jgi:type VII secretion effector (TIGR04197 family)